MIVKEYLYVVMMITMIAIAKTTCSFKIQTKHEYLIFFIILSLMIGLEAFVHLRWRATGSQ